MLSAIDCHCQLDRICFFLQTVAELLGERKGQDHLWLGEPRWERSVTWHCTQAAGLGADGDSFYEYLLKARHPYLDLLDVGCSNCQVWLQGGRREDESFLKGSRKTIHRFCSNAMKCTEPQLFGTLDTLGWHFFNGKTMGRTTPCPQDG